MNEKFHVCGSLYNDSKTTQKFRIILNIIYLAYKLESFCVGKTKLKNII